MPHCWKSCVMTHIIFSLFQGRGKKHYETWINISYTSKNVWKNEARIFLLVDLRDFFSDLGSGDEKK